MYRGNEEDWGRARGWERRNNRWNTFSYFIDSQTSQFMAHQIGLKSDHLPLGETTKLNLWKQCWFD